MNTSPDDSQGRIPVSNPYSHVSMCATRSLVRLGLFVTFFSRRSLMLSRRVWLSASMSGHIGKMLDGRAGSVCARRVDRRVLTLQIVVGVCVCNRAVTPVTVMPHAGKRSIEKAMKERTFRKRAE